MVNNILIVYAILLSICVVVLFFRIRQLKNLLKQVLSLIEESKSSKIKEIENLVKIGELLLQSKEFQKPEFKSQIEQATKEGKDILRRDP